MPKVILPTNGLTIPLYPEGTTCSGICQGLLIRFL